MNVDVPSISTVMWVNQLRIKTFPALRTRIDDLACGLKLQSTAREGAERRIETLASTQHDISRQIASLHQHKVDTDEKVRRAQEDSSKTEARFERKITDQAQDFQRRITESEDRHVKLYDQLRAQFQEEQKMRMALQANVEAQFIDAEQQRSIMAEQLETIISDFDQLKLLHESTTENSQVRITTLQQELDQSRQDQAKQAQQHAALAARIDSLQSEVTKAAQQQSNPAMLPPKKSLRTTSGEISERAPDDAHMPPPALVHGRAMPKPQSAETANPPFTLANNQDTHHHATLLQGITKTRRGLIGNSPLLQDYNARPARLPTDTERSSSITLPAHRNQDEGAESPLTKTTHRQGAHLDVQPTANRQNSGPHAGLSSVDELSVHPSQRGSFLRNEITIEYHMRSDGTLDLPATPYLGRPLSSDPLEQEHSQHGETPITSYKERPSAVPRPVESSPLEPSSVPLFGTRRGLENPQDSSYIPSSTLAYLYPAANKTPALKKTPKTVARKEVRKQAVKKAAPKPRTQLKGQSQSQTQTQSQTQSQASGKPAKKSRMLAELEDTWNTGTSLDILGTQARTRPKRNASKPAPARIRAPKQAVQHTILEAETESEPDLEQPDHQRATAQHLHDQMDDNDGWKLGYVAQHRDETALPSPQPADYESFELTLPPSRTLSRMKNRKRRNDVDAIPEGESERGTEVAKRRRQG